MSDIVRATAAGLLKTGACVVGEIHLAATTSASTAQITDAVAALGTTIVADLAAVANSNDRTNYCGGHVSTGLYVEAITAGAILEIELL